MNTLFTKGLEGLGYHFIAGDYLPEGRNEYYLRDMQLKNLLGRTPESYRRLNDEEIEALVQNGNHSANWNDVFVSGIFNPALAQNSFFAGRVRIGNLESGTLKYHDYVQRTGIHNSTLISCDVGDNAAINNCPYISHYIIGNGVILSNVLELDTTNHSKFGEGIVKEGEEENVRVWIDPLNEAGGRGILPFYDMIPADAYLWAIFRDDTRLMEAFKNITQNGADARRGYYGAIGHGAVIKHCGTIKDVRVGDAAYIKGANKLKNITIKSSEEEPAQIGEGVELVNGIVGFGSHVFYGCKAVRFVLGNNCKLNYGARLINSVLGDNSTISCCEVLNNLVFPAHEQHHNNSFLIATMVMGLSNMAAGATIGSNHNSRGNDGEIIAGRGFWPGLSCSIKHNSRFASYCLVAKGVYPAELYIPFPFSLLTTNQDGTKREVMPAYMWLYNMYALLRNSRKYKDRDTRLTPVQRYETEFLAPDTAKEILDAIDFLKKHSNANTTNDAFYIDERILERSKHKVRIIKPAESLAAYNDMLVYYAVGTLVETVGSGQWAVGSQGTGDRGQGTGDSVRSGRKPSTNEDNSVSTDKADKNLPPTPYPLPPIYPLLCEFSSSNPNPIPLEWENLGGQLAPRAKAQKLRDAIRDGKLSTWEMIHAEYKKLYDEYPVDKALNALAVLRIIRGKNEFPGEGEWNSLIDKMYTICDYIEEQVQYTKRKDYADPFRMITYRGEAERDAVLGKLERNPFIVQTKKRMAGFRLLLEASRAAP